MQVSSAGSLWCREVCVIVVTACRRAKCYVAVHVVSVRQHPPASHVRCTSHSALHDFQRVLYRRSLSGCLRRATIVVMGRRGPWSQDIPP